MKAVDFYNLSNNEKDIYVEGYNSGGKLGISDNPYTENKRKWELWHEGISDNFDGENYIINNYEPEYNRNYINKNIFIGYTAIGSRNINIGTDCKFIKNKEEELTIKQKLKNYL